MQLVQNVISVTLCVDSRHTFFITFCVNGIRSVSNDKHFVSCYDRWHNYSIVLIFDELVIIYFFFIFFYQYCRWISPVCYPLTKSEGYIFASSVHPSVHSVRPHFCPSGTISQYLFVILESFFVQMICTMHSRYPISFVKTDP